MLSLMSINYKFMDVSPKRLVELILNNSKNTKGIEAYIDINKEEELKYLDDLVFELNKNNLILQIHAEASDDLDKQINYFKTLEKYSDILGYPLVVTIHTRYNDDKNTSINESIEYLSSLLDNTNNNKIILCLENLNDADNMDRLEKEVITPMILNDELLYFTYDIGHEIVDYGKITDINEYMFNQIRNVHIHTHNELGQDHLPIYKDDPYWNELIKAILFLETNKYKYNVVYEYGLEHCYGDTTEDKIIDYLRSIDYVSERYIK